jgi:trigger factor
LERVNVKSCEKKEKSTVELVVEVAAEEFDAAVEDVFRKSRHSITVPGFRKGKAPRKIVERLYGASVFNDDAVESISPQAFTFGLEESGIKAVDYPRLLNAEVGDDKAVTLTFMVPVYPDVKLGQYTGLSAVRPAADVPEAAVDSELAGVRLRNARIETASRPAIGGDTAYIDYEGFMDGVPFEGGKGENYELVLGSGTFIPGFEQQVQGMRAGEERDIELTFPADYKAEELAGKPAVFKVKLRDLKEKILPELDDEFAKDVSEFDTLEEYKNSIRDRIKLTNESEADAAFETAVLDKVVEGMECDMPEAMIEQFIDSSVENYRRQLAQYGMELDMYLNMSGGTMEQLRESMRPNAERQARYSVAVDEVARLENIEAGDDEVEAEYKERAEQYGADADDIKAEVSEEAVRRELVTRKALKLITDSATALAPPPETETAEPDSGTDAEKTAAAAKPKSERKPRAPKAAKKSADADTEAAGIAPAEETEGAAADAEKPKTAARKPRKAAAKADEQEPQ